MVEENFVNGEKLYNDFLQIYNDISETDAKWGHIWKMGTPLSCVYYAITEMAEALDARLRAQRPDDSRNRDKSLDEMSELADTAMMIVKAFVAGNDNKAFKTVCSITRDIYAPETIGDGIAYLGVAANYMEQNPYIDTRSLMFALAYVYKNVPDLPAEVKKRLDRIEKKSEVRNEQR